MNINDLVFLLLLQEHTTFAHKRTHVSHFFAWISHRGRGPYRVTEVVWNVNVETKWLTEENKKKMMSCMLNDKRRK